jgi:anti-sigma factor RsiW
MSAHKPELMSALLDGELKGLRRLLALRHARQCPLCAAEYRNLRHVRKILKANPAPVAMSDSPEFFWSKVKREIESRSDVQVELPSPKLAILDWLMQHQAAVVTATAALIVGVAALWALQTRKPASVVASHQEESPVQVLIVQTSSELRLKPVGAVAEPLAKVEKVSTAIPNTVATALDSADADVTVIWVSGLPWTPDITQMKTEYANLDT